MGKMSELAYDIERAAHVIANDNFDLRTQLDQLRQEKADLISKVDYFRRRNLELHKAYGAMSSRYYRLAEECGHTIEDDE